MKSHDEIKKLAVRTLETEAEAIRSLTNFIDSSFIQCVEMIAACKGRVVLTGIGKSAIICQKITATLNSTGTPSIFMHAADAIHGDLGIIQKEDIIIVVSKSGSTPEIKVLVPLLKSAGNKLVALTGNIDSYLAKQADIILNCTVEKEACPNNLAPTSSTTAQLAMGDALAVCLLENKGFTEEDFAKYHPGGALGKRLYLKVSDLSMQNLKPRVSTSDTIEKVIMEISSNRLGATAVIDNSKLEGIITDGDLRRMLEKNKSINGLTAKDIMSKNPRTIDADELAVNALAVFQKSNITQLLVTKEGNYFGFIHFHDLMREGII